MSMFSNDPTLMAAALPDIDIDTDSVRHVTLESQLDESYDGITEDFSRLQLRDNDSSSAQLNALRSWLSNLRDFTCICNDEGNNLLHQAILSHGRGINLVCILLQILKSGAKVLVNQKNKAKLTPVHLAVLHNQPKSLNVLIQNGGCIRSVDAQGNTALHLAAIKGSSECMHLLLRLDKSEMYVDMKNHLGYMALHCAIMNRQEKAAQHLCINQASISVQTGKDGRTALHISCEYFPEILPFLINKAPEVLNAQDYSGNTALHIAVSLQLNESVKFLVQAGVNKTLENLEGKTPKDNTEDEEIIALLSDEMQSKSKSAKCIDSNTSVALLGNKKSEFLLSDQEMKRICKMLDASDEKLNCLAMLLELEIDIDSLKKLSGSPAKSLFKVFHRRGFDRVGMTTIFEAADLKEELAVMKEN